MTGITAGSNRLAELADRRTGNAFDFLRIVLASLVIFSHAWFVLIGTNRTEPFAVATHGQLDGGQMAVNAFFILSGFLITRSWQGSANWRDYLSRRVLRIYPGFLVAAAISAVIVSPFLEPDPNAYWRDFRWPRFLAGLLDLQLKSPQTTLVNGSLWTIRFEFICYLGVLFLGLTGLLARRTWVFGGLWLALGILAAQEILGMRIPGQRFSWLVGWVPSWPRAAANFLAGMAFFLYRDRVVLSACGLWASAAGLMLLGLQPWIRILPVAFPLIGGYLLLSIAHLGRPWMHDWARRRDLSYGMYLYAYPIQMLLARWLGPSMGPQWASITPLLICLAAMPMAVVCALASWYLVEAPAMRIRRPFAAWLDRRLTAGIARASGAGSGPVRGPSPVRGAPGPRPSNPLAVDRAHR